MFLSKVGKRWNISLFHYRNHGAAYGRVLVGLQIGFDERALRYYTYQYRDYIDAVGAENVDKYNSYRKGAGCPRRPVYNWDNAPIELKEPLVYDALVVDVMLPGKSGLEIVRELRSAGTQEGVVDRMQTRAELYDVLGYHEYEDKLDELFAESGLTKK